jgi:hypothetical protein
MSSLLKHTKSVRKTFTLPNYIAKELEDYAKDHDQKQSQIVAVALETYVSKQHKSQKVQKRLQALDSLIGAAKKGSLKAVDKKTAREEKAKKHA